MKHATRWTIQKITKRLGLIEPLVYRRRQPLPPFRYRTQAGPLEAPLTGAEVDDSDWEVIEPYTYWGRRVTDFTLHSTFQMPADWDANAPIALYLPIGESDFSHPEALAYIDGVPYASCDRHHQEILLPAEWRDGQPHRLALHGWTGLGGWDRFDPHSKLFMSECAVVQIDQPTRDFVATARVALGVAERLEENAPARDRLLNALDGAFRVLDTRDPLGEDFYASVGPAHAALRAGIAQAGPPLEVDIVATGHAHLDVAWLWTVDQIRRKAGRTFHTVLRLMEQFPEYHFVQSQPQLYDFVRQDYPELFAAIRQRLAEGRWEPLGGTWVEPDCNLAGPEALARQFLLGRAFFREQFGAGADSPILWLPDAFGFAWSLPQLIKQAGLEYFFTIKISWSQYNRLPYSTFWWQGLDGTRVLTHFSTTPADPELAFSTKPYTGAFNYNATAAPAEALGTWMLFPQKELKQELLMVYGHGDGGGGPTREMLENIREMGAMPGAPRVRQGSARDFFRRLEASVGEELPTWNGELYLELHRGTFTTQGRNKRANRKSEFLLHDAEFLATLATVLDRDYEYPVAALRRAWELVCLNQFHDILPGSGITEVYRDSLAQYAEIESLGSAVREAALAAIVGKAGSGLWVVNPTSFSRSDLAFWSGTLGPGQHLQRGDGTPVASQPTTGGTWIAPGDLLAYSLTPLRVAAGTGPTPQAHPTATPTSLENNRLLVELNEAGDIVHLYDKANEREVVPPGAVANQFQAFQDRPLEFDAWDIDRFYDDQMWTAEAASSARVVEAGPLRATLEVRRRILHSDYIQRISLAEDSPSLNFNTTIDWRERHTLLKVAFPVNILAPTATYEIQWGNLERPTHQNTSWDWARFEVCAQKWVDLSEGGYGVSLINDCKYGHDIRDNVIRLSLLRSPTMPDPEADQGEHRFAYSLLPHVGDWRAATSATAYALNDPLIVAEMPEGGDGGARAAVDTARSFVAADQPNVIIETVKRAEDGRGIIVRLYESQRRRGKVNLQAGFALGEAWRTNLLEENEAALAPEGNSLSLYLKPYEIVTLRLVPAQP